MQRKAQLENIEDYNIMFKDADTPEKREQLAQELGYSKFHYFCTALQRQGVEKRWTPRWLNANVKT